MKKVLFGLLSLLLISPSFAQIRTKQMLTIKITGVPAAEKETIDAVYQVSDSGHINMWKIDSVKAAGLSPEQLAARIAAKYRAAEIYTNPTFIITSNLDAGDAAQKMFTVGGQVRSPGPKPWSVGMTLFGAVQSAGGGTPFAATNRVTLLRNGKRYTYNLKLDKHKSLKIYERDLIEVPQKKWNGQ